MVLTMKDKARIDAVQAFSAGKITVQEAAKVLQLSERQAYRLKKLLQNQGLAGMLHKNRGRPSLRRIAEDVRRRVLELAEGPYRDINDTHLCELLAKREKIFVGRESLRKMLRGKGIGPKRRRRSPGYRSRRPRKEAFGMMIQVDGSPHDWLEGRGPWMTLVGGRDDATNHAWGHFVPTETTWAYLDLMRRIFTEYGMPLSLYSDKHSIFYVYREPTLQEQLNGTAPLTQFGRAMVECGVNIIPAHSPQAKGRIERFWGFGQDRLVTELRLAGACNIDQANAVLAKWLRESVNVDFIVSPALPSSVFRKAPVAAKLDRILCLKDTRRVAKDHTVSFEGLTLQIPPSGKFRSIAGKSVEVLQLRDGSIRIDYRGIQAAVFSKAAVARLIGTKLLGPSNLKAAA